MSWRERGRASAYFDNTAVHCCLCGKTIARMAWVVSRGDTELTFCEPDCERLYKDYWLPRYGQQNGSSGRSE